MITSENLLGIPKQQFGSWGIHTGNIVSREIAKQNKGFKAQYNSIANKVTVLNSSDLPQSVLRNILYDSPISSEYKGWYPVVEKERNKEGNLEISFSYKPIKEGLRSPSTRFVTASELFEMLSTITHSLHPQSLDLISALFDESPSVKSNLKLATIDLEEVVLDIEEVD